MNALYLFDACLFSHAIARDRAGGLRYPSLARRFDMLVASQGLCLASVTVFEIRRGLRAAEMRKPTEGLRQRAEVERLLAGAVIFPLDDTEGFAWDFAAEAWARARAKDPPVQFPEVEDLLAAATAYAYGRVLLTTDETFCGLLATSGYGTVAEAVPLA